MFENTCYLKKKSQYLEYVDIYAYVDIYVYVHM